MPMMNPGAWAALFLLAVATLIAEVSSRSQEDLAAGRQSYTSLCQQCHGADGDSVEYAEILPIAGINRRYPAGLIGELSGRFSGRVLFGRDRDRLVQFLGSLRGEKDFPDPGWLITPLLLERKAPLIREFRVLDARGREAYLAGHATNAVSIEPGGCLADAEETTQWLGRLGVTPSTVVVVYDDIGGPAAACAWWRIRRAGHQWVTVLDGGWSQWVAEARVTATTMPKIEPAIYPSVSRPATGPASKQASVLSLGAAGWNWEATLGQDGFRRYEELNRLAQQAGVRLGAAIRVIGPEEELAHLALTISLLGYRADYDPRTSILSLNEP
jgi:hypothetical protein